MKRRIPFLFLIAAVCLCVMVVSVSAKSRWDRDGESRLEKVEKYAMPQTGRKPVKAVADVDQDIQTEDQSITPGPLGTASPSGVEASPGLGIFSTTEDWQYSVKGRYVDFAMPPGPPSIQFSYTQSTSLTDQAARQMGTNYYNPYGSGDWPRGFGVGCRIQQTDEEGRWVSSVVDPLGRIVVAGEDNTAGFTEHHIYGNGSVHSCFFSGGSQITATQYMTGFISDTATMRHPVVDLQVWNSDTIYHVVGHEGGFFVTDPSAKDVTEVVIQYFRKVNGGPPAALSTWEGPLTIDTARYRGVVAASRVSGKVAVAYVHHTPLAFSMNQDGDTDIYYRKSDSAGSLTSWSAPINITNYDRSQPSRSPWIEVQPMYTSDDYLHIIFEGNPWPADVYDSSGFFFGDFTTSLFHWTDNTDVISRVANRDYGIDWNTQVCGFGGTNTHYLAFFNIAECNNRLYVVYAGWHDIFAEPPIIDDCASSFGTAEDRRWQANGELYLHVSSSIDGLLWDAPRNLTQTHTPECDSAGFGGICLNDTKPMMARYGMDVTAYDSALTFPGSEFLDVDPDYNGNYFLHIMFLEDHFPGNWALGDNRGSATENDLKWLRIGCIDPITAAQIDYNPKSRGYPSYVNHGEADTVVIEVVNDGNTALFASIDTAKVSPSGDWLGISKDTLHISEGINNTGSFEVYINNDGLINSPGTIVALNGEVYILSNAPDPRDSVSFLIEDYLVADTVVGLQFDTLYTSATAPSGSGFVGLIATSHGEIGYNGNSNQGGYNLDYTLAGDDCDSSAVVYLYSGGPYVVQDTGGGYEWSAGVHNQGFASHTAFKPVTGFADPAKSSGSNYQKWFTGTFVNWDTTLAFEKELYAPTGGADSTDFMIQMVRVFSIDGNAHNSLALGEIIDWDIPSDDGSNNQSGVSSGAKTVYIQGVDTADVGCPDGEGCDCQENAARYGAQSFLGWYNNTDFNDDNCANNNSFVGVFSALNDSILFLDDTLQGGVIWNKGGTQTGLNAYSGEADDLHSIMTFVHGINLGPTDTLTFWSAVTTVHNGTESDLVANVDAAKQWYADNIRPGCDNLFGCCVGITGNVDGDSGELTDIGDLTALIAYLYIPPNPVPTCPEEANIDGDSEGLIDIGDLTALIAYLYIPPNPEPAACQ